MNRWIKRAAVGTGALAVLAATGLALGSHLADRKLARRVEVHVAPVAIPTDADSIARGRYLFASRGCAECHGPGGGGHTFLDDGKGFVLKSPDITATPGGVTAAYQDVDWVRAIRHGVKPSGQPLFVMPSDDYNRLTDADLGALVAYVKQLPAAGGTRLEAQVPAMVKALYAAGVVRDAAEKIDHALPPAQPVPEDGSARHGAYVANMCVGCHNAKLTGGKIPGGPPDWPAAANLTSVEGGGMSHYATADQFVAMLRTGKRPDGYAVSTVMPFPTLRELSDNDARALFVYLKELPPQRP